MLPYFPPGGSSATALGNEGRLRSRENSVEEPSEAPAVVGRAEGLGNSGGSKSLGEIAGRR